MMEGLKRRTTSRVLLFGFLVALSSLQLVSGDTWFELKLIKFANPTAREADGDCCDFPCSDPCDPSVMVCFDKPDTPECSMAVRYTGHYHANTFYYGDKFENGASNPMRVKIAEAWPKTLYLTVVAEDRDAINANDPMGKLRKTYTSTPAPTAAAAAWQPMNFVYQYQTITAYARVYCDVNFYGDDCMTFCQPMDSDVEGHYTCAVDGSKICRPHFYGANCTNFCTDSTNDTEHFYCNAQGQQICASGWSGERCTEDIDECYNATNNPCSPNGECSNTNGSFICNCSEAYTGRLCDEVRLYCDDGPCSNHSNCTNVESGFQCQCDEGWTGTLCYDVITPCSFKPCKNNGRCHVVENSFTCKCVGVWEGNTCETEVTAMKNDTMTLFLKGSLPEDKWDEFTLGIKNLLKDKLGIVDATIETSFTYPSEKQTKVEVYVLSRDPRIVGALSRILVLPEEEVKSNLILPLSEAQEVLKAPLAQKPDPWVKRHWYTVLIGVAAIIGVIAGIVITMFIVKRRRHQQFKDSTKSSQRSSGRESLPDAAAGFDNSLYFEVNQPEKVRGLPSIPGSPAH